MTFAILVFLLVIVLLLAEGVRLLRQIRDQVKTNIQVAMQNAMNNQELAVLPASPGKKISPVCICKHPAHPTGKCLVELCTCLVYVPDRGPWPSDPGRM